MTNSNPDIPSIVLPEEVQDTLNSVAQAKKLNKAMRIFVGIPNMATVNVGLVARLFDWAQLREFELWFRFITEKRPIDFARNLLAKAFWESPCEYLLMIDADIEPHPKLLQLAKLDKDIVAGNAYCWINDQAMPSIWQRAECEQCFVVKKFQETGKVHDPSQYTLSDDGNTLNRWNPFHGMYQPFYTRTGKGFYRSKCRCQGTGFDPWVYRTHQSIVGAATLLQCHSVGGACMMIARRVFETMPFPPFRFLYRESGEILLTEDHYFCWKAGELGFTVWGDPQMVCNHYKTVNLWAVNKSFIRSFEAGVQYQKQVEASKTSIIIPTEAEIASVSKG